MINGRFAYVFHVASSASAWQGDWGVYDMRKRKPTKPRPRHQFSGKKPSSIFSRLDVARGPITVALTFGLVAAVIGYTLMRNANTRNLESEHSHHASVEEHDYERPARVQRAPVTKAEVIEEYGHDPNAFTQGLVFHEGIFFESTGLHGRSSVRKVEVSTGRVIASHELLDEDFGEGIALTGEDFSKIVQVIWKVGKAYVYDRESLREISDFSFEGDGWGLASHRSDSHQLFLSDGTSTIKVVQLEDDRFRVLREITIRDGNREVGLLNELEVIGNELWANIWMSDFVARIDIETGKVNSWLDLRGILRKSAIPKGHTTDVLNGIAYDTAEEAIYVTGKNWPKMYRISATDQRIADDIASVTNAFFLNPDQVAYVHQYVIA